MRYLVLASDYDGTLAHDGRVDDATVKAMERLQQSGRKLLLVTGRELDDLKQVFPQIELFELVVAENGGLLYNPRTKEERSLTEAPNPEFLARLKERGVPFSVGRGVVATWEPHQTAVLETIKDLGLELQVSFNKGAVMVLPSGVNKRTGLEAALAELALSPHNVVGIGDGENDHVFLTACECGVAVANALPSLKERADIVTRQDHGAGVAEIVEELMKDDLQSFDSKLKRHSTELGRRVEDEQVVCIPPYRGSLLFAGPSGSGKSSAATGVVERLAEQQYQFCLIDPEGDYENFMGGPAVGFSAKPSGGVAGPESSGRSSPEHRHQSAGCRVGRSALFLRLVAAKIARAASSDGPPALADRGRGASHAAFIVDAGDHHNSSISQRHDPHYCPPRDGSRPGFGTGRDRGSCRQKR